jgi:hypothetical protein
MPLSTPILVAVIVGLIVGGAFAFGAPVVAIPLVAVFLAGWLAVLAMARISERRRRLYGRHEHVRFTDEDKPTLAPSETPGDVHINPADR